MEEMKEENSRVDALIAKVLSGEGSAADRAELDAWKSASPGNHDYYQRSLELFEKISDHAPSFQPDVEQAWTRLQSRLEDGEGRVIPLQRNVRMWRIAAVILFVFTVSVLVYRNFFSMVEPELAINAGAKPVSRELPDGSRVTVNKNSSIAYVVKKGKRVVELKGEASFEVKHDSLQPFEVLVGDVIVQDIGTAFTVREAKNGNLVQVWVTEGEVHFYSTGTKGIILRAGDEAEYDRTTRSFSRLLPEAEQGAGQQSRVLDFRETPLREVVARINAEYGSDIRLKNPGSGNCLVTVLFNREQLDVMVTVLAETLDLQVRKNGEVIYLEGQGCE